MKLHKRILLGSAVVVSSMTIAVLMTFVYAWLCKSFPQCEVRFDIIFGIGGSVLALDAFGCALLIYTNGFGEGLD